MSPAGHSGAPRLLGFLLGAGNSELFHFRQWPEPRHRHDKIVLGVVRAELHEHDVQAHFGEPRDARGDLLGELGCDENDPRFPELVKLQLATRVLFERCMRLLNGHGNSPYRGEVAGVNLRKRLRGEPGGVRGVLDRLRFGRGWSDASLELDHDETPRRIEAEQIEPIRLAAPPAFPGVELECDDEDVVADDLRIRTNLRLQIGPFLQSRISQIDCGCARGLPGMHRKEQLSRHWDTSFTARRPNPTGDQGPPQALRGVESVRIPGTR